MVKNKILIAFFVIFIFFYLTTSCSATFDFTYNDKNYSIPTLECYEDFFITDQDLYFDLWSFSNEPSTLYFFNSPLDYAPNNIIGGFSANAIGTSVYWYRITKSNNSVKCFYDNSFYSSGKSFTFGSSNGIAYSTYDLYDKEGNIFFQSPLPPRKVVVGGIQKVEEILPMLKNLMRMIIPIGLKAFSMLLIIYLIVSKKWFRF